jgi:hypothetical protein
MEHELRVSDEERDRTTQVLREHFATGRLTQDELDERVQAVYRASTRSELARLVADLPALPPSPAELRAAHVERRGKLQRRLLQQTGGALGAFVICTVIWLASGASGQFWPIWVALAVIIPLVRGGWDLYGPAPDLDRFERQLEEREHHHHERAARRSGSHQRRL